MYFSCLIRSSLENLTEILLIENLKVSLSFGKTYNGEPHGWHLAFSKVCLFSQTANLVLHWFRTVDFTHKPCNSSFSEMSNNDVSWLSHKPIYYNKMQNHSAARGMLFWINSGISRRSILAWRLINFAAKPMLLQQPRTGHTKSLLSVAVRDDRLFNVS